MQKFFLYLKNLDWILLAAVTLLVVFGLVEIYSVALGNGSFSLLNFKKQAAFASFGFLLLIAVSMIDYFTWRSFGIYLYFLGIFLLVAVLVFGQTVNGTKGWFNLFGLSMQPVEFVKIILIIFLARYFSSVSIKVKQIKHLLVTATGTFLLVILVLKQPDFGSALILLAIWAAMVAIAGFDKKYLFTIILFLIFSFLFGWFFYFKDYQKQRILTFINPTNNSLDQSYNITQAIIAVGSGRLTGRGIGFGSQSQLKFLPEAQNDFIFAVIAEELGFLGISMVLFFFAIFFYRILAAIKNINNDFGIFFLIGVGSLIFIEMFINIGMNIGLLPVVGISLPFLSYGGSAIVSTLILVGIVESVIIRSKLRY